MGIDTNKYGASFEWQQPADGAKATTQWSPFGADTTYFEPCKKDFMINFIVEDLEALLPLLRAESVAIVGELEIYEYGKFAHILDLEGNKLELWQPI